VKGSLGRSRFAAEDNPGKARGGIRLEFVDISSNFTIEDSPD
jgi:hypothetical protein